MDTDTVKSMAMVMVRNTVTAMVMVTVMRQMKKNRNTIFYLFYKVVY